MDGDWPWVDVGIQTRKLMLPESHLAESKCEEKGRNAYYLCNLHRIWVHVISNLSSNTDISQSSIASSQDFITSVMLFDVVLNAPTPRVI